MVAVAEPAQPVSRQEGRQAHHQVVDDVEIGDGPLLFVLKSPPRRRAGTVIRGGPNSEGRFHHEEQPRVVEGGGHLRGGHHRLDPGPHVEERQGPPPRADAPLAHDRVSDRGMEALAGWPLRLLFPRAGAPGSHGNRVS